MTECMNSWSSAWTTIQTSIHETDGGKEEGGGASTVYVLVNPSSKVGELQQLRRPSSHRDGEEKRRPMMFPGELGSSFKGRRPGTAPIRCSRRLD